MTRLLCIVLLVACGPKPGAPAHSDGTGPKPGTSAIGTQPGGGPATSGETAPQDDQCDKLIDHVVTLAVAERPKDQMPTDAERENIATQLRAAWGPKCPQLTSRGYQCALDASTLTALDRCGG